MKYLLIGLIMAFTPYAFGCDSGMVADASGNCVPAPSGSIENTSPLTVNGAFFNNGFGYRPRSSYLGGYRFPTYNFGATTNFDIPTPATITDSQTDVPTTADSNNAVVPTPGPTPASDETPTSDATTTEPTVSSQESLADTFASYDSSSCQWTADLPRKLHNAPGCTRSNRTQICVGYVVCNAKEGGGKFVRTATCGADKCGNDEAVSCVNDRAYSSQKPDNDGRNYMSDRVRGVLAQ